MRRIKRIELLMGLHFMLLFFPMVFGVASSVFAMDITLQWAPINSTDLAGYKVYYRQDGQSYDYSKPYWECTGPECTVYDLDPGKIYYFVVRAFDTDGNTSTNSNEVELRAGVPVNNADSGGGKAGGGSSGCFIATAAYGSMLEPHVQELREFRDRFLLTNGPGKIFVKYYYEYSPRSAHFIARHAVLRTVVCFFLLPILGFSWMLLNVGPGFTLLFILLTGVSLVYIVRRRKNAVSTR
jgi:hypothetical protein